MTQDIPKNLEEAFILLATCKDIHAWVILSEKEATATAHFGMGIWIRNNWGLWKGEGELHEYFVGLGLNHADDMSGVLLTSLHRKMNGKDLDIEGQVVKYLKHWEQIEAN